MKYVYILRSIANPTQTYIGFTSDLRRRLRDHNSGQTAYTDQFRPWKLETYLAFSDERKAKGFERYIKHGSGHAFLKKHF
jgi:putative endonuclease